MLSGHLAIASLKASLKNGWKPGDPLPTRLKILNWGENDSTEGKFILNDLSASVIPNNQRLLGRERAQLDFEHNTVPGSPEYAKSNEPRPVAAHMAFEIVKGDGAYLSAIQWTPDGERNAANYEDISPAPIYNTETREVIGFHSAALTHTGAVFDLTLLSAAAQPALRTLSAALSTTSTPSIKSTTPVNTMPLSIAKLAAALQLPADATEDTVIAALAARSAPVQAPPIEVTIAGVKQTFTQAQLAAKIVDLETARDAADSTRILGERTAGIARLAAAGKAPINPATRKAYTADELAKLDIATLSVLEVNTPATVPMSARPAALSESKGAIDPKLTGQARLAAAFEVQNLANPEYHRWRLSIGKPVPQTLAFN